MEEEHLIKQEALDFYKSKIEDSKAYNAIDDFHLLKNRLLDFKLPKVKPFFLDTIAIKIATGLQTHREKAHGGQPGINCVYERKPPKLLLYIKQELQRLLLVAHQRKLTNRKQSRTQVFVSYSHNDKEYLADIQRHFKPFLHQINFWDDTKILPGQKWKEEIRSALENTKVAILLISTDFFGSDFIATNELPPLLKAAEENGAVIVSVIVKPCLFEEFNELNQYQALNPPSKPIIKMVFAEREELYVNLVRQTKKILNGDR